MFCADSSTWIAYLSGEAGADVNDIDWHLRKRVLHMAPVVLAELLSDPHLPLIAERAILGVPLLEMSEGFWERAGKTRARLIGRKLKPKLADTLIAQICIDHDIPLYSRDADFRPFATHAGLRLVLHGGVN